jgi:predicted regulator of Ras-like GTPase activity (Roadblock/LC7/MglB family)
LFSGKLFAEVMTELNRIPGLFAVVMLSYQGKVLESSFRGNSSEEQVVATGLEMKAMLEASTGRHGIGTPAKMVIDGEHGRIAVVRSEPASGYMLLVGTTDLNVGLAGIALRDVLERLAPDGRCEVTSVYPGHSPIRGAEDPRNDI